MSYDELLEVSPSPSLIMIAYEEADEFQKGDHVRIYIDGDIAASYPGQAKAKNIELLDE